MDKLMNAIRGTKDGSKQVLHKSTYSLVSCGDLTTDTLICNLPSWNALPEEVQRDPSLEQIRKKFEEIGEGKDIKSKKLQNVIPEPVFQTEKDNDEELQNESGSYNNYNEKANKYSYLHSVHRKIIEKPSKIKEATRYAKLTLLLGCWVFFTSVFLMYNEKENILKYTAITGGEDKYYPLDVSSNRIELKLSGPFLSEQAEWKIDLNDSTSYLMIWIVCGHGTFIQESEPWQIALEKKTDMNNGELRMKTFDLKSNCTMRARTDENLVPFSMSYKENPLAESKGVLYAVILLCGLYGLIIFEVINRTMAAMLISTTSLAVLSLVGERPSLPELISWLDVETLLLLFSMMILVSIVAETGLFDYLAVFTFEVTKGKLWPLIYLLCIITAVLSTFLDNVTTILLISPVTIRLCEVMDLDPVPILMLMAMYSNIGGTATPVGDPPNVIVASNKAVIQAGINFTNFTAHMALAILLVCVQTSLQIRYMFRDTNKLRIRAPREIQDLRHQIAIWRRAADSLPYLSNGVNLVRERLERKISKLTLNLEKLLKASKKRACSKHTFVTTLVELKAKYKIRDKKLLIKSSVAIAFVVLVFFMHSIPELNRVSLGWTALLGALLLLTLADRVDLEPILHRVEWSTLLFFASLFVLMEALSKLGLISYIGGLMEQVIVKVDESYRLAVALMLILWGSGAISAFVDNIPLATMMGRVVVSLGSNPALALPLPPLVWALLLGACLGGNGTLIGASANVVCAGVAEQHGYRFSFMQFFKIGFPVMIGHLVVASGYLLLCHCVFQWH